MQRLINCELTVHSALLTFIGACSGHTLHIVSQWTSTPESMAQSMARLATSNTQLTTTQLFVILSPVGLRRQVEPGLRLQQGLFPIIPLLHPAP